MNYKPKIKVVIVAPNFPLIEGVVNGGTQGAPYYLCKALNKMDSIELEVIRPFSPNGMEGVKNYFGFNVHYLKKHYRFSDYFDYFDMIETLQYVRNLSPDIIHFQSLPLWSIFCRIPNVVTIHGISELDVLYKKSKIFSKIKYYYLLLIQGKARRKVKNVIAISPYVHKYLGLSNNQRIWDIPNPILDDFFYVNYDPDPLRIFSASHVIPIKNIQNLIKAFKNVVLKFPNAKLRIAGSSLDSEYGKECQIIVKKLGLSKNVEFLGLLTIEDIKKELSKSACFVLCSYQENAPLSISEAMAVGVPVVASKVGAIPWMIEDNINGRLIDPNEVDSISNAIISILINNNNGIISMNKEKAKNLFFSENISKITIDVYFEILNNFSSPF